MTPIHWEIRRLEVGRGEVALGEVVAEVRVAEGGGTLEVFDETARDLLEELFTEEQVALSGREVDETGRVERTTADILQPWRPETLEYVRRRLGRHGLAAVEKG